VGSDVVLVVLLVGCAAAAQNDSNSQFRDKRQMSLFAIVSFPNQVCTTQSTTTPAGTCQTASECSAAGGQTSGNCAAGFGVCCVVDVSTCSSTIDKNNTYIQNPGFPSSYTPSSTGTCVYTIKKCSDDICQLRFDFQTFTGLTSETDTTPACTDSFAVAGQTGNNPPSICGTNTGQHMYAEIGEASGDTATVTFTWGDTSAKQYNIFVQQIPCDAEYRAPVDCVQYFTDTSGTIQSYNWQGGVLNQGLDYRICIRDAKGYCSVSYGETSGTTIDAFSILSTIVGVAILAESTTGICLPAGGGLTIPSVSSNGITPINPATVLEQFPTTFCGGIFGTDGSTATSTATLTSARKPFELHLFTAPGATLDATSTGFSMDYSQNLC